MTGKIENCLMDDAEGILSPINLQGNYKPLKNIIKMNLIAVYLKLISTRQNEE